TVDECIRRQSTLGGHFEEAPNLEEIYHEHPKFIPLEVRIRDRIPFSMNSSFPDQKKQRMPPKKMWCFTDMVHTIEYLKTFNFFSKLSAIEKRALTIHVTHMTSMFTNSFYAFENKSDVIIYPDGSIPFDGQILEWSENEAKHDREIRYNNHVKHVSLSNF
ncbi:hypothetical protein PENTCL1PPCAC_8680, partial [Pristionchus entomophagus]